MSEPAPPPAGPPPTIYDSPWFWVMLFSAAGLVALTVIGPKHLSRQDRLILKNEGHRRAQSRLVPAGGPNDKASPASPADDEDAEPPALPQATVRALMFVLAGVLLLASYFVNRQLYRNRSASSKARPP